MLKSQEYSNLLQQLFNPQEDSLQINLKVLRQICSSNDYHCLTDLTSILTRLFFAPKHKLSLRQLIGNSITSPTQTSQPTVDFFIDSLSPTELSQLIKELFRIRKKLKYTVYSSRLSSVISLLVKVLEQTKPVEKRGEQKGCQVLGDFQMLEQEYKRVVAANLFQVGTSQQTNKITDLLKSPVQFMEGRFSNLTIQQQFIGKEILPLLERNILIIPLANHTDREKQIARTLKFINQYYVPQYKLEVQISKNTLLETRGYSHKLYWEFLKKNYIQVLRSIATIINEALVCPSSMHIQHMLLKILRRIYLLGDQGASFSSENLDNIREIPAFVASPPSNFVRNPLFLAIRNISLFSEGHDEEVKEAAILSYKIVNDKNDLELATLIENNEDIRFIRGSRFYTSKAYAYSQEISKVYDPSELAGLYLKLHQSIAPRQLWTYTLLVEKPSSLLCWQFYIGGYDIKFGVYKVQELREMTCEEYEQGQGCREVHKMEKVQNTSANPCRGHVFLKNGVYRMVFDNSFSLMRSKDIHYSFLQLEYSS